MRTQSITPSESRGEITPGLGIPITDPHLTQMLLVEVVRLAEYNSTAAANPFGCPSTLLDRLRKMSALDLHALIGTSKTTANSPVCALVLNSQALTLMLNRFEARTKATAELHYFVVNGASIPMLMQLFTLSRSSVELCREQLNVKRERGHPSMPPVTVRDQIHQKWHTLKGTDRERYLALHSCFSSYSFQTLAAVVNERL